MKLNLLENSFIFLFVIALQTKLTYAVDCRVEFSSLSVSGQAEVPKPVQNTENTDVLVVINAHETVPVESTLYAISWTSSATEISPNNDKGNDGLMYMTYNFDLEGNTMDVLVNGSMTGLMDYSSNPDDRKDQLYIYLNFNYSDSTICLLILNHRLIDDNTDAPHFNESTYSVSIREDFPVSLSIPDIQAEAFDIDAVAPNNQFNVSVNDECPLEVTGGDFTCNEGQSVPVSFELRTALDYDTMDAPYQYICTVTLQDYGVPTLSGTSLITVTVTGYPDEIPQFSSNYYVGTVPSVLTDTIVISQPTITAVDRDVPPTDVTYAMASADPTIPGMDYFSINETTAEITLVQDLDEEFLAYGKVDFFVKATDDTNQVGYSVISMNLPTQSIATMTCQPCDFYTTCLPCDCQSTSLEPYSSTLNESDSSLFPDSTTLEFSASTASMPSDSTASDSSYSAESVGFDSTTLELSASTAYISSDSTASYVPESTFSSSTEITTVATTLSPTESAASTASSDATTSKSTDPTFSDIVFLVNGYTFQCLTTSYEVGQVEATSIDGSTVSYSWKDDGSEGSNFFDIDPMTGVITTKMNSTHVGYFDLVAIASSRGLKSAESTVHIVVYAPYNSSAVVMLDSVIYTDIMENTVNPSLVKLTVATSVSNPTFCIESVIPVEFSGSFSIGQTTGMLGVTKKLDADDPTLGNVVSIVVGAYADSTISCSTNVRDLQALEINQSLVNVTILDENDNSPVIVTDYSTTDGFLVFAYPQEISLQRSIGPVGSVHAVDADITSMVTYTIENYDNGSLLNYAVDQDTGSIYLLGSFDCFTEICSMIVIASDSINTVDQPVKIIGLTTDFIHTMILDSIDIADVDETLGSISKQTDTNIHQLYSTMAPSSTKSSNQWNLEVQVYAESNGQLLNLDDFNKRLDTSGANTSAAIFSEKEAFDSAQPASVSDNTGYKVAVGILAAALGIILITLAIILVRRHQKRKNLVRCPPKEISTLGRTYANQVTLPDENHKAEETFFSIFGNGSVGNKSRTSLKSGSSLTSNSTDISADIGQDTKTTTVEAYNNLALEVESPYQERTTKAEVHKESPKHSDKPNGFSYFVDWEKQQKPEPKYYYPPLITESNRKSSLDLYSFQNNNKYRKTSLALYPSLTRRSSQESRESSSSKSCDSIGRSSQSSTEDQEKKSVAFKVLLETKEFERDEPIPAAEPEKSVAFKVLVETKQIEPEPSDPQDIFTIL